MAKQHPMQTPTDLFVHELSDIHSAEQIIIGMLGEAQGIVQNPQLKQALQQHLKESEQQAKKLEQAFGMLGQQPHPVTCHAAEGLQKSLREALKANPSPEVLDGVVLGGAQETEHLEIAAYTGLIKKARMMGQTDVLHLLEQNLQQEQRTLQLLETIGDQMIQQMAAMAGQGAQAGMQSQAMGG